MARNLKSIRNKATAGPFTEGQLRWYVFNSKSNGLDDVGAIVRVQRRVYIDEDRFNDWIERQNGNTAPAAA